MNKTSIETGSIVEDSVLDTALDVVRWTEYVSPRVGTLTHKAASLVGEVVPDIKGQMVCLAALLLKKVKVRSILISLPQN